MGRKNSRNVIVARGAQYKEEIQDPFTKDLIDFNQRHNDPEAKKLTLEELRHIHALFRVAARDRIFLRALRSKSLNRQPILTVFYEVCKETFKRERQYFDECMGVLIDPEADAIRSKQINKAHYRLAQLAKIYIDMMHAEKIMAEGNMFLTHGDEINQYARQIMMSASRVMGLGKAEMDHFSWKILNVVEDHTKTPNKVIRAFENKIRSGKMKIYKIKAFVEQSKILRNGAFTEIFAPGENPLNANAQRPVLKKKLSNREAAFLFADAALSNGP